MNPKFLREAICLSREKMETGEGGPFGAIIVQNGRIIGLGWNRVTSTNDPTAHAEIVAIRDACLCLKTFSLAGCEIYASCEPCPMCFAAIYWAKLDRTITPPIARMPWRRASIIVSSAGNSYCPRTVAQSR
jgi:guanine deaminase